MIPKIIHYCWFGGNPLPPLALKCIESWRKYLPDYEIKEWNEDNFDVNIIPYTAEAYKAKKYAFVSDYARFWILYKYGGLYFDTDVEVIRNMDDIIERGPFMGCESSPHDVRGALVAPGLGMGAEHGNTVYNEFLQFYSGLSFFDPSGAMNVKTIVEYTSQILSKYGLILSPNVQKVHGIFVYPQEYFCPLHMENNRLGLFVTKNTYTIHHWAGSWQPKSKKLLAKMKTLMMNIFGDKIILQLIKTLHLQELRTKIGI